MQVRTDDEVYRVDAVWLGPPKATFPWRARYVAWGVGILVFFLVFTATRWVGFGFGFFSVAWNLIITVVLTRFFCSRISHERPLGAVMAMWVRELTSPREKPLGLGGATSATRVRVHGQRPRPRPKGRRAAAPRAVEAPPRHQRAVASSRASSRRRARPAGTGPVTGRQQMPQPLPPTPPGWQQRPGQQTYHPQYGPQYGAARPGPMPGAAAPNPGEPWSVRRDQQGALPQPAPGSRRASRSGSRSRRAARRR